MSKYRFLNALQLLQQGIEKEEKGTHGSASDISLVHTLVPGRWFVPRLPWLVWGALLELSVRKQSVDHLAP